MSSSRRLKREIRRSSLKSKRQFDKAKVFKTAKSILIVLLSLFAIVFLVTFYAVYRHNSIRRAVSENPSQADGKVVSISTGRGTHVATYEFYRQGKKYSGSTFVRYQGKVKDTICVTFLLDNPELNIHCDDMRMESWIDDSLITSIEIIGIALGVIFLILIWKYVTGDSKLIAELTSRKK
jgi:hypothetical protein